MAKSAEAFRTISEVADWLEVPTHVLRFWESKFPQVKPVKRAGGRRYYRPADMSLLAGIRVLLHDDGITIRGVQKILREQGVKHVAGLCDRSLTAEEIDAAAQPGPEAETDKDDTVVELTAAAFPVEDAPVETPVDADPDQEPLPLFSSRKAPAAQDRAPAPDPTPEPEAAPTPAPASAPRLAPAGPDLPGPSPQRNPALAELARGLATQPGALSGLDPAQVSDLAARLQALRDRLAGSDPT